MESKYHFDANKVNQIWPEFKVEGDAKIQYTLRLTPVYSTDQPVEKLIYEQDDLDTPIELPLVLIKHM